MPKVHFLALYGRVITMRTSIHSNCHAMAYSASTSNEETFLQDYDLPPCVVMFNRTLVYEPWCMNHGV